jgi:uncharacterized protein YlaI
MLVEYDKIGSFRDATNRLANSPTQTFLCCRCNQGKAILGRRKVGMLGKRALYACKLCMEDK